MREGKWWSWGTQTDVDVSYYMATGAAEVVFDKVSSWRRRV